MAFLKHYKAPHCMPLMHIWILPECMSPGIVMPLMNTDIGQMINKCKYGHWNKARKHISQILIALNYLHTFEPPLMHRDLKPENVLLDPIDKAYLTDFGFCRFVYDDISNWKNGDLAMGSAQTATPSYSAPEMVSSTKKAHNEKVDIWATGVIALEMVRNDRLRCSTDKGARKYFRSVRHNKWQKRQSMLDQFALLTLEECPDIRASASELLHNGKFWDNVSYDIPDCEPFREHVLDVNAATLQTILKIARFLDYSQEMTVHAAICFDRIVKGDDSIAYF